MQIGGLTVEIIRKKMKNVHVKVLPPDGKVLATVPMHLPESEIRRIVQSHYQWILEQQAKIRAKPAPTLRNYVSGETLYLWGQMYVLQVEYVTRGSQMLLEKGRAILRVRRETTAEQRKAIVNEWYRDQLKAEVAKYLPKWEKITGLYCSGWQSKNMVTRWGTCNTTTRKIWLNLQLAKRPVWCLEYVILHELAHLKVKGHGPDFTAILDYYMPCWREILRQLNEKPVGC